MNLDRSYSGQTANKTGRSGDPILGVVWHETASPNPDNPHGTLKFNLAASVGSSYHYLIARDGTVFEYLDPAAWIAWHAGKKNRFQSSELVLGGTRYVGMGVNRVTIGIELDGKADGTPATAAQLASAVELARSFVAAWNIPLDRSRHFTHKELTTLGYRSDPRCVDLDALLLLARRTEPVYSRAYRVTSSPALLRSAPERQAANIVDRLDAGVEFRSDGITFGETVDGSDEWLHTADQRGFIHSSIVERV